MCYTAFLFPPIQDPVQGKMLHLAAINLRHIALFYLLWYSHFRRIFVVVVQSLSCVWLFCDPMDCSMPCFPVLHNLPDFAQTHVHWISDAIQPSHLCHRFLLLPLIFPSIRVFCNELALLTSGSQYWNFSFSLNPSNEYSGLISFRIDWFYLLAVQGTI